MESSDVFVKPSLSNPGLINDYEVSLFNNSAYEGFVKEHDQGVKDSYDRFIKNPHYQQCLKEQCEKQITEEKYIVLLNRAKRLREKYDNAINEKNEINNKLSEMTKSYEDLKSKFVEVSNELEYMHTKCSSLEENNKDSLNKHTDIYKSLLEEREIFNSKIKGKDSEITSLKLVISNLQEELEKVNREKVRNEYMVNDSDNYVEFESDSVVNPKSIIKKFTISEEKNTEKVIPEYDQVGSASMKVVIKNKLQSKNGELVIHLAKELNILPPKGKRKMTKSYAVEQLLDRPELYNKIMESFE